MPVTRSEQTSTTATMLSINRHPDHRVPLQVSSTHTQNAIANSGTKRGPKPKPLTTHLRYAAAAQRVERSYNREKKLRVVSYWLYALVTDEKNGGQRHVTRKEVSARFLIPEATISGWKKHVEAIMLSPKGSRAAKPDPMCAYHEMEEKVFQRFWERRMEGQMVRRAWFRLASRWYFGVVYPDLDRSQFKFSNGWFLGFLSRWGVSIRMTTNKATATPGDYQDRIIKWFQFNRRNSQLRARQVSGGLILFDKPRDIGRYFLGSICNMDQTPLPFEYLSGRTYSIRGDKTVWAKATKSGWDKRQATLMLAVFADGIPRIPPIIIFHGTENEAQQEIYYGKEKKLYDKRVVVWFNKTAYTNEQIMLKWILTYLIPALSGIQGPSTANGTAPVLDPSESPNPGLIALDAAQFHKTPKILECLRGYDIIPSMIPGGCTGFIQPLDVSVNGPFKNILCDLLDEEMDRLGQAALDCFDMGTENAKRDRRILMTKVVGQAWEKVSSNPYS